MADEKAIIDMIEQMIQTMLPIPPTFTPPEKMQVNDDITDGRGTALLRGAVVNLVAHPTQVAKRGATVVGVPIGPGTYYVVGRT